MINRFLDLFRPKPAAPAQQRWPDFMLEYAGAHQYDVPAPETYQAQAELMAKVSYLYTVVTLTAQSAASLDYDVVGADGEEIEGHPLEKLLDSPNPMQTGIEFMRDHYTYKLLNGSSYWWLNTTSPTVQPSEIWLIPPGNIAPVPSDKLGISHYLYYPGDGQEITIPTDQIIWFRGFHPSNLYASLSGLVPLSLSMQTDIATQKYLRTVYGPNSGRLPGIIAFKSPVSDTDWQKIKQDIKQASQSQSYMMLRGAGEGVTWLQAAATIKEMETMQGRLMTKEDIYNTFAPGLMNMTAVNATEANATTGKKTFQEFTLYPLSRDTEAKINKDLMPRYAGAQIEIDDPRDLETQENAAKLDMETKRASVFTSYAAKLPVAQAAELAELPLLQGMVTYQDYQDTPQPEPAAMPMQSAMDILPKAEPEPMSILPQPNPEADAIAGAMLKWERYAQDKFAKRGQFVNDAIPPMLALRTRALVMKAQTPDEIPAIFAQAAQEIPALILAAKLDKLAENG